MKKILLILFIIPAFIYGQFLPINLSGSDTKQCADGGFIAVGEQKSWEKSKDNNGAILFKTDRNGNLLWEKKFGESGYDAAHSVQICSDGGFIVAGKRANYAYLFKFDKAGNFLWEKKFGKGEANAVQICSDGGYVMIGSRLIITNMKGEIYEATLADRITSYVKYKVNEWQKKGEFEKTNDYLLRVNEKNRTVKIKEFQETEIESLKLNFLNSIDFSNIELGDYDADNETFLLEDSKLGNLVISVPINEAKLFKANFPYYKFAVPKCVVIDDKFVLSYVELTFGNVNPNGTVGYGYRKYSYNLDITQDYSLTEIDYNFSAIEIDDIASAKKTKSSNISTNKIKVGTSSVNINIPYNKKVKNRYALIIGNEDYTSFQRTLSSEQNVDYAVNDATIFQKYCLNTLGVEEDNMFFLTNATAGTMYRQIDLITKILNKVGTKAELIVYYAGHGYPDELTKIPYLIPVDVSAANLNTAIKLDDFYKDLSATGAKSITVFLDACFTGGGRESGLMASRGVKVKPKEGSLTGNLVVFSASSGNQSALPYHQQGHGMFTYHLLKKLQESKGKVSMGELADYIHDQVSIQSLKTNEKEQDPIVNTSSKVINDWRNWKF